MNTNNSFSLSFIIGFIIIGLIIILFIKFKKGKYKPNYRLFFILGTTWVPLGVVLYITTRNFGFFVMSCVIISVIYLSIHWITDVITGAAIAAGVIFLLNRYMRDKESDEK